MLQFPPHMQLGFHNLVFHNLVLINLVLILLVLTPLNRIQMFDDLYL
jgi:hypothetical protein